jgi:O-antigen/teichoic acid export membrane protein
MSLGKIIKLSVSISLTIIGLTTAVTTLIFMGHNNHWQHVTDELIATPLIIVGFCTALTMFIISCVVSDHQSESC